jgi:hypothetical protein
MQLNAFSLSTSSSKNKTYSTENQPKFGVAAYDRIREQLRPFLPPVLPQDTFVQSEESEPDLGERQNAMVYSDLEPEYSEPESDIDY